MKRFIIFSLLATVLLWHSFALEIKRQNLSDLKNLYQTGEYEEAIKLGVKLYHFNKNTYKIQTAIICSYISLAQYNWYDFENGNYFSSKSLELLSKNRSESQEYVNALLEVVDAHIQRNEWIRADSLLNSISKPTVQANLDNYIKFNLVNANLLKNKGKYLIAIDLLDQSNAYLLASNNEPISKINTYRLQIAVLKSQILLAYGTINLAKTSLDTLGAIIARDKSISNEFKFYLAFNQGLIHEINQDYSKATASFLKAFNVTGWNEQNLLKQNALQRAAINTVKDENWTEFEKLIRRVGMYSFKRASQRQAFAPSLAVLQILEATEKGQYKLANQKCNKALKDFEFIPQTHQAKINFIELKQKASEYEGDLISAKAYLDTLDKLAFIGFGPQSIQLAANRLQRAIFEVKYGGDFASAKRLYSTYFDGFLEKSLASNAAEKLDYLENYAILFDALDKPDSALSKAQEAFDISTISIGKAAFETQYFQSLIALYQFNCGKYPEFTNALNLAYVNKSSGNAGDLSFYIKSLFLQSSLLCWLGEFDKMEDCLIRAYKISNLKDEKKFFDRFQIIEDQAAMYIVNSNLFKAERNLKTSIDKKTEKNGDATFVSISPIFLMADLKLQKGDLQEAYFYINKYETLCKAYFPKNSTAYANLLSLQSRYFLTISDFKKADDFQLELIDILSGIYGPNHVRLASEYAKQAEILLKDKNADPYYANKLYEKALKIVSDALGESNPLFANLLVKQAELLLTINNFPIAESNLNKAESFWEGKLGKTNTHIAQISLIKGQLNYLQKKYHQADEEYNRSADMFASLYSKLHPGYLSANIGLSKAEYMKSEFDKAEALIKPVLEARLLFVSNNFSVMNFSQKSDYWAGFKEEFEFFNSILYRQQMQQPKSDNMAQMYNYAIQTKGLLLNSDAKLRRKVLTSGDSSLSATYNEWLYQKEYYALVATFSKQQLMEDKISPEEIGLYIEDLEKQINVKTGNLLTFSKVFDWKDVKNALPEKSTSVEMVRFRYFNQNFTDTVIYACLSISKEDANGPNAIFSTDGKLMESSYLKYYRNASINKLEDENSYTNYWKPFVANVPSGNTIFFSSEGVYNQINPEMLYDETVKKYALEANTFVFVSSTKDLVAETEKKKVEKSLESVYYLFGNPKFYDQKLIGRKDTVANLPGAAKEIEDISAVLTKNARKNIKLLGSNVTEDTLKAIQNPSVIHIATHGFFMEQNYDESATQNPMLNSGLMLSGSGNILATLESTYINQKPGILTASEVMELNFSNTNLVVLSACETGRGQVEVGEGVYGLQRAFLVAGAKAIILSLFKVDDEATRLLMSKFYEKSIQNGGDYRKAFREAKQALRDSPEFEKPVFWGSFIMIEGKPAKNNGTRKSNQGI